MLLLFTKLEGHQGILKMEHKLLMTWLSLVTTRLIVTCWSLVNQAVRCGCRISEFFGPLKILLNFCFPG